MENAQSKTAQPNTPVMRSFKDKSSVAPKKALIIFVILLLLGASTGYGLSSFSKSTGTDIPVLPKSGESVTKGKTYGSDDTQTFKDTAEGTVREGGIEGEGQYHLERSGGESQNVYMTSSTVDLSQFIGKKIKVWGQTQQAQKAGWLMDVGRIEVL
jgi:hypothetical protein